MLYLCSLRLSYGVMVALQILVLSVQVRILVAQQRMSYGVMVALQILALSVQVRVLVAQLLMFFPHKFKLLNTIS